MYFDFDDRYRDIEPVGSAINRRDGVALSIFVHAAIIAALLFLPQFLPQLSPEEQITTGVTADYIRLSVGTEDIRDIIADLDQAIRASQA